jgi:hypothetical protein
MAVMAKPKNPYIVFLLVYLIICEGLPYFLPIMAAIASEITKIMDIFLLSDISLSLNDGYIADV